VESFPVWKRLLITSCDNDVGIGNSLMAVDDWQIFSDPLAQMMGQLTGPFGHPTTDLMDGPAVRPYPMDNTANQHKGHRCQPRKRPDHSTLGPSVSEFGTLEVTPFGEITDDEWLPEVGCCDFLCFDRRP
jgi:hypothetical protein